MAAASSTPTARTVREPDAARELAGDVRHLLHLVRADLHTRNDDELSPPRMGGVGAHGGSVPHRRDCRLLGRSARQSAADRSRCRQTATAMSPGGNMEGKEVRFGIANTALFATVTTAASCGAINGWLDRSHRSAASCRSPTCSGAKWSSAASGGCTASWSTSSCRCSSPA